MTKQLILLLLAVVLALSTTGGLLAGASFAPSITRWTTSSGGTSNGSSYTLHSTTGQVAAGQLNGGSYVLDTGFDTASVANYKVLLPLTQR